MKKTYAELQLRQLDERLREMRPLIHARPPRNGAIRAIRQALGMTQPQLARRLAITRQSLNDLEKAEVTGKITLESLARVAQALGCRFAYTLVPELGSLAETRKKRALQLADAQMKAVAHSMKLEAQAVGGRETRRQHADLVEDLLHGNGRNLWR